jgi:uncharacterized protein YggE
MEAVMGTVRAWVRAAAMCFVAGAMGAAAPAVHADDQGITVLGVGTATVKPTVVEIAVHIAGQAELAADANVKYADLKKKAQAAVDKLNNPDLVLESKGFGISSATDAQAQMRIMQGMGGDPGKPKIEVTEQMTLVLKNADKVEPAKLLTAVLKIIDACRDAGLQVGPRQPSNYWEMQQAMQRGDLSGMVTFKVPDATTARDEAYKQAIEDAKAKAGKLAELSGAKLGRVLCIEDEGTAKAQNNVVVNGMEPLPDSDKKDASSSVLEDIKVSVRLNVQFEIQH